MARSAVSGVMPRRCQVRAEFLVGGSEGTPDARMAEKQALDRGYIYIGCGIAGVPGGTLIGPEPILNLDAAIFEWDGPLS
jgi:hypothetical protein